MPNPNYSIPDNIPSIFDRADGTVGADGNFLGGVAEPTGAIMINTPFGNQADASGFVTFFYECPDSPQIESGEQSTIIHKFNCDYSTAQTYMTTNPRGTYLTDQYGNVSRVLSTRIDPVPRTGMRGVILTMTSEGEYPIFPNPPDEFDIETVELNPALDKHPRYANLNYNQKYIIKNANVSDNYQQVQQYVNQINGTGFISNADSSITPAYQLSASLELLYKEFKGIDTFYLAGYKIQWSQYYWYPQPINPGGYIEDPIFAGGLPAYFWSSDGTPQGTNVFSQTLLYNPNMYPQNTTTNTQPPYGLSWLRQADTMHLNRTWWRITRTWIGGPIGHWDNELYTPVLQPYQTSITQGVVGN